MNRRDFLQRTSAAGVLLSTQPAVSAPAPAPTKQPICVFSKDLAFCDYPTLAEVVAEAGFDGIDLTVRPNGHVTPERVEEDLPRMVEAAKKAGVAIPMMVTALAKADAGAERLLKTAAKLGIKHYRMGWLMYTDLQKIPQQLESYCSQFSELADLNRQNNIVGDYQNHQGDWMGSVVWDLWYALRDLDPRWLGCQYDIFHATLEGTHAWPLGLNLLKDRIHTLPIKDFTWKNSARQSHA